MIDIDENGYIIYWRGKVNNLEKITLKFNIGRLEKKINNFLRNTKHYKRRSITCLNCKTQTNKKECVKIV